VPVWAAWVQVAVRDYRSALGMFGTYGPEEVEGAPEDMSRGAAARLDSSSAMVRAEADHLDATLHALVTRLSSVPGLQMSVSYRHGKLRRLFGDLPYINDLNRRTSPIQRVVIAVGPYSYWLHSDLGSIRCGRDAISAQPGQVIGELTFSVWAKTLSDEIARQNLVNHDSLVALRHLVESDRVD
jgi:hypothetical protein